VGDGRQVLWRQGELRGRSAIEGATKARVSDLGFLPAAMSPAAFRKFVAADIEKWAKVVQFAGVKLE
jgi:tripartite-type tricarboxylate transporter receptor subunit TctC